MYLMNVPPVAATRTEWRTCGTPIGYSLPVCFNDSDNEVSTRDTPVSDKVQMIIESLRSSQSSLNMGDETKGDMLSGQEGHPHICNVSVGSFVGSKYKSKDPTENQQADFSSSIHQERHDSDSDDSVDRGIEEAILEYLKEKDDHKRKAEPCISNLQSAKIPRKNSPTSEVSKQHSDSNTFLIASSPFPKSVKVDTPRTPAIIPMKKYIKNKASLEENPVKKMDLSKSTTAKCILPNDQTKAFSKPNSLLSNSKFPVRVKVEENLSDSSSDDGIEEAIQRYQLEKNEQQNRGETFKLRTSFKEESDSTSDDGIEEAIRCYQLEQLKEKSVLKTFLHKQKPVSKSSVHAVGSTNTENMKKHKLKKKNNRTEKEVKSVLSTPSSVCISKNTLAESLKGNGLLSVKVESFGEQQTPTPPKVNTSAELMCAEAILDISKAVMPGGFQHNVSLNSCAPMESLSLSGHHQDDGSGDSSIDSEDGIEQEIRKFLEQKAQMHKQPSGSAAMTKEPDSMNEPDKVQPKQVAAQKKPQRLSLSQRRKHKEEASNVSKESVLDGKINDKALKPLPEHGRDSSPVVLSQRTQTQEVTGLQRMEQSGDKSSSLDSDEDLDTAIKDLLKTKKKSKKKTRDLKHKSKKCLKDGQQLGDPLQTKKCKPDPISKRIVLKKFHKSKDGMREKYNLTKKNILQHKQTNEREELCMHGGETHKLKGSEGPGTLLMHNAQAAFQIKEDSSSVDSDDSIEQEIRKFLAEKAKVSNAEKTKGTDVASNGNVLSCTRETQTHSTRILLKDKDIKQEGQLAGIPTKCVTPLPGQSPRSSPESKPPTERNPLTPPPNLMHISSVSTSSRLSSVISSTQSLLEPADGAGAVRTEQRRPITGSSDIQDVTPEMSKPRLVLSTNIAHSRSEPCKWRQSLGLPTTDIKTLSRTPFHITSSKISETASAGSEGINRKSQTQVTVWSSVKNSRPLSSSSEKTLHPTFRSPVFSFLSASSQHPGMSFAQRPAPGACRAQCPAEGETESTVHMSKDQSVFVELEKNRTNHVQVRSREMSERKEREPVEIKREVESKMIDDKEVHVERTNEDFIDETDCESDRSRSPEKKQGFSTL